MSDSWKNLSADQSRKELVAALTNWGRQFKITDDWIFQAALETMFVYHPAVDPTPLIRPRAEDWYWIYAPKGGTPLFSPMLTQRVWYSHPHPSNEHWEQFKQRMESEFRKQLTAYRRSIERIFGTGKSATLSRDAEWTVRYQKGEPAHEIAGSLTGRYRDREQAVYRAIERFAAAIDLNLGKTKRRQPSR
jgi:hypothetical protein